MEHNRRPKFLHWVTRVEVKTPNRDIPVVTEFGPFAFKEDAVRKATLLRDIDYSDYFSSPNDSLKTKWHQEGPPFCSLDVDPFPDLDDNQIQIRVRDITISESGIPKTVRSSTDAPRDESDDEIDSDPEEHTGLESTPRPHVNWKQHEDGTHYRLLDGWMVVVNLTEKETVFGPYATEIQANRMRRKLFPIIDKAAFLSIRHEAHMA